MIKINPINISFNRYNTNFSGTIDHTTVKTGGKLISVNNYTSFFRDYETLEFTKKYLQKNFPDGIGIAEFGCSMGQKPYSLMIVLDDINQDRKYKMKAYDFPEVIDKAKSYLYKIDYLSEGEKLLLGEYNCVKSSKIGNVDKNRVKFYRDTFFNYFRKYRNHTVIDNPILNSQHLKWYDKASDELIVQPNDNGRKLVDFASGDINDIDKILKPKENGVVIFQNALYHILNDGMDLNIESDNVSNLDGIDVLFNKINKALPQKGLFVIGKFPSDHLYNYSCEEKTHLKYQNNKQIRVYDSSPVHETLKKNGFEPVLYEPVQRSTPFVRYKSVHLPSVWKKVREL